MGTEGDYNILAMELLGPSLEALFDSCGRRFSLKTALMCADQMVSRIEYIHTKSLIHRDVKPENFLIGLGPKSSIIHIIDFGLAKLYRDLKVGRHIPFRSGKLLTGTARYASINTHMGLEQSRRDDMEGIFYVILYFLRGQLPWQGLAGIYKQDKYKRIMEVKMHTPVEVLCAGFPSIFIIVTCLKGELNAILRHARKLRFEEEPNYAFVKELLKSAFTLNKFEYDFMFDWILNDPIRDPLSKTQFVRMDGLTEKQYFL